MTDQNRIAILEKYCKEDPTDPFNFYALALEVGKQNAQEATKILIPLIKSNPDYLPSYYQAALFLIRESNYEEASTILEQGIIIARKQNDSKTLRELMSLSDEMDA